MLSAKRSKDRDAKLRAFAVPAWQPVAIEKRATPVKISVARCVLHAVAYNKTALCERGMSTMYWHIDTDIVSLIVICSLYVYNAKTLSRTENVLRNRRFLNCLLTGTSIITLAAMSTTVTKTPVSRHTSKPA